MRKLFLIISLLAIIWANAQSPVNRIEYFFNTDPGMGNATAVSFSSAPDIADLNFSADISGLPAGINRLYIRSRSNSGRWSQLTNQVFYRAIPASAISLANLSRIEYFFNTDPGFGAAIAVPFTTGTDVVNLGFVPDISSLPPGINYLFIRCKDANGKWSQVANQIFYKLNPLPGLATVTKIEYFFNTDPGFGSAVPVSFSTGSNISDLGFAPDITSLPAGVNYLYVRSKDANGKWSHVANQIFYKLNPLPGLANINKIEYYFNTDPGFGLATLVTFSAGSNISDLSFTPDVTTLSPGVNRLHIRSKDANGKWSQLANQVFYKLLPKVPAAPINRMEYFVNTDPGIGKGVPLVFNPAQNIADFSFPANITSLPAGMNFLYFRSLDTTGKWSLTAIDTINITTPLAGPAIIVNSFMVDTITTTGNQPTTAFTLCAGKKIRLAYDPTGLYALGNIFEAQLSDANGLFTTPVKIGEINSTTSGELICTLPRHLTTGANYKIRVVSNTPLVTGDPINDAIIINDVNLGADTTVYQSCFGETTNLTVLYNTSGLTALWNTGNPTVAPPGNYRLIATAPYGCPDTAFANIVLEVATWTGTVSNDWHTAANWNINKVPTNKTHVIVNGITPNPCVISNANATAASIQVKNGGTINTINNRTADVKGQCVTLPPN